MSIPNQFNEIVTQASLSYAKVFPHSVIKFSKAMLDNSTIYITLTLQQFDDIENRIVLNDVFHTTISVTDSGNGLFELEHVNGSLNINPVEKYLAMSSVKCKVRRTVGDATKIVSTLAKYFEKRHATLAANKANIYKVANIKEIYLNF